MTEDSQTRQISGRRCQVLSINSQANTTESSKWPRAAIYRKQILRLCKIYVDRGTLKCKDQPQTLIHLETYGVFPSIPDMQQDGNSKSQCNSPASFPSPHHPGLRQYSQQGTTPHVLHLHLHLHHHQTSLRAEGSWSASNLPKVFSQDGNMWHKCTARKIVL